MTTTLRVCSEKLKLACSVPCLEHALFPEHSLFADEHVLLVAKTKNSLKRVMLSTMSVKTKNSLRIRAAF